MAMKRATFIGSLCELCTNVIQPTLEKHFKVLLEDLRERHQCENCWTIDMLILVIPMPRVPRVHTHEGVRREDIWVTFLLVALYISFAITSTLLLFAVNIEQIGMDGGQEHVVFPK